MLSANDRLLKIATASPAVLARVDAVLLGTDTTTAKAEANCRLVTYTDAAKRLGVSRPTVYRLAKAGRLETVPLNGSNRILLQSVIDCVNRRTK